MALEQPSLFHEITVNNSETFQLMKGDIVAIHPYDGGNPSGHIAAYDGRVWISDFVQRNFWSGGGYRSHRPNMSSTVIKAMMFSTVLTCLHAVAAADQPNVLREPVLGLRYEPANVNFEPLPDDVIANCETLQNDANRRAVWYLFSRTTDASSRTYYIIGGYEIPTHMPPGRSRFDTDGLGVTLFTEGNHCTVIDTARQVFDDQLYDEEMPQQTLRALAKNLAERLLRAYGNPDRLRRELRNQHIN